MFGLKVFSGSAHPALAQAICRHLGIPLGRSRTTRFSNENLKVAIEENVRGEDVFVVQPSCPPVSEGLVELLVMLDALKGASAERITAVLPYYPYARSDKKDEPRISITARLIADLLKTAGADRVLTVDLHSPQIQGFFRIPSDQLTAVPILCDAIRRLPEYTAEGERPVVVAADVGEAKDAGRYAKRLDLPLAFIDKRRYGDDEQPRAVNLVGEVAGRDCILVDDEIATGGTIFQAAEFLAGAGARSVQAAVVHPVLSGRAMERLRGSRLRRLVVTDTIPLGPDKQDARIEVHSVAPLLAQAISSVHDGRSVSDLFT